jgi:superfamily II DNA/RNA helicase
VLHVASDQRFPVLRDLAAAPGRIMIFTRTKHGAKKLTSTLTSSGVPAVEMHGNLSQNNRTRNLAAFSDGSATAMVATDVAARGIHVDDVALVVHFDPPVDHKVYVHRSGRTARAGAEGTVVTMMTDDQQAEVRDLVKKAGIAPTITRVTQDHALLAEIAPGERQFVKVSPVAAASPNNDRSAARGGTPNAAQAATAAEANRPKPARKGRAGRPAWEPDGTNRTTSDWPRRRSAHPVRAGNGEGRRVQDRSTFP